MMEDDGSRGRGLPKSKYLDAIKECYVNFWSVHR